MSFLAFFIEYKKWFLIAGLIGALLLGFEYWELKLIERGKQEQAVIYAKQALSAQQAAQQKQTELQAKKDEAINAAQKQIQQAKADAAAASATAGSLRKQLADANSRLSNAPIAACREYAATLSTILGQCTSRYIEVATAAQSHSIDAVTCQQAWPKQIYLN